jgi:hypothetical protein
VEKFLGVLCFRVVLHTIKGVLAIFGSQRLLQKINIPRLKFSAR